MNNKTNHQKILQKFILDEFAHVYRTFALNLLDIYNTLNNIHWNQSSRFVIK